MKNPESRIQNSEDQNSQNRKTDGFFTDTRMSFGDHLMELRSRLIKSIYGLIVGFVVCLYFRDEIFSFLAQPLLVALYANNMDPQLYVSTLPEAFLTYLKVALYGGIFLASPWIFYQMWGFVAAGLYPHERRYVNTFVPFSVVLFILGGVFFVWIVAPITCSVFIRIGSSIPVPQISENFISRALIKNIDKVDDLQNVDTSDTESEQDDNAVATEIVQPSGALIKPWFTLQKYVSLIIVLAMAFGLAFQMPLVVFILGRLSLVEIGTFQSIRKYMLFGIVVFSAMITPPDVFSQISLSVPMYVLYELGIMMIRFWPRHK